MNNIEVLIKLNIEQVNIILGALQELPAKICNPINNIIVEQANEQLKTFEKKESDETTI